MSLDPKVQQSVEQWQKAHLKACPLCSAQEFESHAVAGMPVVSMDTMSIVKDRHVAVVPVTCMQCGYTILVALGSLQAPEQENPSP